MSSCGKQEASQKKKHFSHCTAMYVVSSLSSEAVHFCFFLCLFLLNQYKTIRKPARELRECLYEVLSISAELLWLFLQLLSSLPSLLLLARYITSAHEGNNTEQLHDIKGSVLATIHFANAYAVKIIWQFLYCHTSQWRNWWAWS